MALKQYFYIVLVPLKFIPKRTASFWQTIKIPNRFVLKICTGGFADYKSPECFLQGERNSVGFYQRDWCYRRADPPFLQSQDKSI